MKDVEIVKTLRCLSLQRPLTKKELSVVSSEHYFIEEERAKRREELPEDDEETLFPKKHPPKQLSFEF